MVDINKADDFSEDEFRLKLITAQYELRESVQVGHPSGLLVLVNGVETAGKGKAVTTLREWLDPRLLKVSYLPTTRPAHNMPIWQRHAKPLPRHGEITVMFGNWYADLIYAYVKGKLSKKAMAAHLQHIAEFEKDLMANDTHLVKCWFDISNETLMKRLKDTNQDPEHLYKINWQNQKQLAKLRKCQQELMTTSTGKLAWQHIDGENLEEACQQFCGHVLAGLKAPVHERAKAKRPFPKASIPEQLVTPPSHKLKKSTYREQLKSKQARLAELVRENAEAKGKHRQNIVLVFEGMDAAGKGGAIRRLVSPLDPREYRIHNIGVPEPEERQHPYLWRFWHRLPARGGLCIFDRSWYGRVLVERVEALVSQAAWQEAYSEINRFEEQLVAKNTLLLKFWLAIDMDVQLARFKERENTPHKRFKITPDDWRNRDRWEDYVQAAADMLAHTDTKTAPWHVVATNDKYTARLAVLEHCIQRLEAAR